MKLVPHYHVTIDTDANDQCQFKLQIVSNSPGKPGYGKWC